MLLTCVLKYLSSESIYNFYYNRQVVTLENSSKIKTIKIRNCIKDDLFKKP